MVGGFGFVVDGDEIGVRKNVFFHGDGDVADGMEGEEFGGEVGGEGFDEAAGSAGGAIGGLAGDGGVIDGVGDFVFEVAKGAQWGDAESEEEGLRRGDFLIRDADVAMDFEPADFDDVRAVHGAGAIGGGLRRGEFEWVG